jgi:type II secretory pathway component PulK
MSKIENQKSKIPGESGMILAMVLILLGITVALITQAQIMAFMYLKLEQNKFVRTQLRKSAGDGVWQALNIVASDPDLLIDHTNEVWAVPIHWQLPNGTTTDVTIIDENRFIDANMLMLEAPSQAQRSTAPIICDLLTAENIPAAAERTQIIRDWIDTDLSGNYEAAYYKKIESPAEPPNAPLESREELLWLMGKNINSGNNTLAITVLCNKRFPVEPVNVNTADRRSLSAVFGRNNSGEVERIINLRNRLPRAALDKIVDAQTLQQLSSYLSVHSSFFSIYSKASDGAREEEVYCLAQRDQSGNVSILRWVERQH